MLLRTRLGEMIKVKAIPSALETFSVNHVKGAILEETKVVKGYPQFSENSFRVLGK